MVERESEWNHYFIYITNFIGQRLSSSELVRYIDLMKLFRSGDIEADKILSSLLVLFEEDECLSQMFNRLMEPEIRELKKNDEFREQLEEEAKRERKRKFKNDYEVEEGEIQEDHRRVREEADLPIKKRSKYRLESSGPVLKTHEFVSVINQNLGEITN